MAETFGPYRLESLLGRGGMGEVFRAADTRKQDRLVAIKRLPAHLIEPQFVERFRREAHAAASLRSPHVVPIHDYGEIDGRLFLDMALVEGRDLARILHETGPIEPGRAVDIVAQTASALDAAHQAGLVHRDVKPSNVLLIPPGPGSAEDTDFVYLTDFGIAQWAAVTGLTSTGAIVGTMNYMAPERFTDTGVSDARVDIYALGCVLFEILVGRPPFAAEDGPRLMYAHLAAPPPAPSQQRPTVARGFDGVVARAMAKDPSQRYASAGELARHARAVLATASRVSVAAGLPSKDGRLEAEPLRPDAAPQSAGAIKSPSARWLSKVWWRNLTPVQQWTASIVVAAVAFASLSFIVFGPIRVANREPGRVAEFSAPAGDLALSPDGRHAYISSPLTKDCDAPGVTSVVETGNYNKIATVPLGCGNIALSPDGKQLLIFPLNALPPVTLNTASGATTPLPPPSANELYEDAVFTPDGKFAYVTHDSGPVTVIDASTNTVASTINILGEGTPAISPDGKFVYVSNYQDLQVINTSTQRAVETIGISADTNNATSGVTVSPDGRTIYVAVNGTGGRTSVFVIDLQRGSSVATIPLPPSTGILPPSRVFLSPDGHKAYVSVDTGSYTSTLMVIDTATRLVSDSLSLDSGKICGLTADGREAYVCHRSDTSVVAVP